MQLFPIDSIEVKVPTKDPNLNIEIFHQHVRNIFSKTAF